MRIGLRIDVDTLRGTRDGVPNLCRLFARQSIKGTFFFSVGPDNMGRHLFRLLRPSFLGKMLRTRAASLYGWDIIFKGTFWPGPVIGKKYSNTIRATACAGHEIGLHAWDHHSWQANIDNMEQKTIESWLQKGMKSLEKITGHPPVSTAAPAWKCRDVALTVKNDFCLKYNSDCRGESIFYPVVNGERLAQPQIPVTLPTYDEIIGQKNITKKNYNEYMLSLLKPDKLNVLAIHAEVEGIACFGMFKDFIKIAQAKGVNFIPLGNFLSDSATIDYAEIIKKNFSGREGWISCQSR
ncbi:MAG: 4-deoxy-4-formamido-L-arabinose-phosphoundecaprenol deformylase [Deltaproteobacteria bacterium]|nr:4-deoxy-4-formamido-L-arabinose-phosphoundecaprenol deformylase [Deltaproteobacteria bacterium]